MSTLTVACGRYDRTEAIHDGRVGIDGRTVIPVAVDSEDLFPRVVTRGDFDVSEMSLSSYVLQISRGEGAYIAVPIFLSRAFRHAGIYVRSDRGIRTPKDLEGRLVGIPEYQMTFGLWIRGILADEFGVDVNGIRYRTAGTNQAGRVERLPLALPPSMDVRPFGTGKTLTAGLASGELDAVLSPTPPRCFGDSAVPVRMLFDDPGAEERAYFRKTGFFPIMHVLGIRKEIVSEDPDLPRRVFDAFVHAKRLGFERLAGSMRASVLHVSIPWIAEAWAETLRLMGPDYWSYGAPANRKQLEAICRYSFEQHLSERPLTLEDLFVPSTLELTEETSHG